jgi:nucleotide-binding universal stress UspA family protein
MDLKRILAAVDLPNGRDDAFERALALAHRSGAELYLLHAVPVHQPFSFRAAERLQRQTDMRERAEDVGVGVRTIEQHGDAAEVIELHANPLAVDLIVRGGEARQGWHRRSPVAERVVRRTNVPTLVVASGGTDSSPAFRNVLVALDLSAASQDVLVGAIALTAEEAVRLTVMHTVNEFERVDAVQHPVRWITPKYGGHVLEEARQTLEAVASSVPAGIDTRVHVSTGGAASSILECAANGNADLVVG